MKSKVKSGIVILASVLLGAIGSWLLFGRTTGDDAAAAREQKFAKSVRLGNVKKITEISVNRKGGEKSVRIVESESERPNLMQSVDEDDGLTDVQRSVLMEIQDALDADDLRALRRVLSRFVAGVGEGGLGGYANVPRALRLAAVQALGWFGKDAVADLVDFMADPDEEISTSAFDQFELALADVSLSDRERADIVKTMSKALTDEDRIDTMLVCLNEMRNSVRAETVIAILSEGSAKAKEVLVEQIGAYIEDGVSTVEGVEKWLAENPDDADDELFYGGDQDAE